MAIPGESELRQRIQSALETELKTASELLAIGTGIFQSSVCPQPKDEMNHLEACVCLGIVAKASRQYRGILALIEIALGDVAESNTRMLMETMLVAYFLMRPSLVLKQTNKPLPGVLGNPLTTAFRTKLYLAQNATNALKTVRELEKHRLLPSTPSQVVAEAEKHVAETAAEIGPEWIEQQKKGKSYSGVGVLDLAESLDMGFLYHALYRPSSAGVHGTDATNYIEPIEKPEGGICFSASSSTNGVRDALAISSRIMFEVLDVTNQRFGLGLDEQLKELKQRVQAMTNSPSHI